MQTVIILREELICFIILLYLFFSYSNSQLLYTKRDDFFPICFSAICYVISDAITVITVNNLSVIPAWVNEISHFFFIFLSLIYTLEVLLYLLKFLYPDGKSIKKIRRIYIPFGIIYLIGFHFLPKEYVVGSATAYCHGLAAVIGFVLPFFLLISTLFILIKNRNKVYHNVFFTLLPMLLIMLLVDVVEAFYTEILITGGAVTLVTLAIYQSIENPSSLRTKNSELSNSVKTLEEKNISLLEQLSFTNALSSIYEIIYLLDTETNKYVEIKSPIYINDIIGMAPTAKDFLNSMCDKFVCPDDLPIMHEFVDLDTISYRINGKNYLTNEYNSVAGLCRCTILSLESNKKWLYMVQFINNNK